MYCPSCGTQLAQGLSYCKHCGANLRTLQIREEHKSPEKTIDSVVWVIVGTTITILGMCLGALVLMSDKAIDFRLGTVFVILSFVALVLVEAVLVWRLVHLNKGAKDGRGLIQPGDSDAEAPETARMHALSEPGVSVTSITENTTRELEPSYSEDNRR